MTTEATPAETDLAAIIEAEADWDRDHDPEISSVDEPLRSSFPDVGAAAQEDRLRHAGEVLEGLQGIDRSVLAGRAAADYDVLHYQATVASDQQRFRMYQRPANADTAFWMELTGQGRRRLGSTEEAESYIAWLQGIPAYIDQQIDNMRAGVDRGFGPPQVSMVGRDATIRTVAESAAGDSAFAQPFGTLTGADHDQLTATGLGVVDNAVLPAFRRLLSFVCDDYFPRLPQEIAAYRQPDGEAWYSALLYEYATTDLTAEQIHRIGLESVAEIKAEMAKIAAHAGFSGADAMLTWMRNDPHSYPRTAAELLHFGAWQAKKFDAVAHHYFGRLPRMRFGIEEPAPDLAPFYTFGRGGPHQYILNTYDLGSRPLYSVPALTLHEAAPGHAFQMPLALELDLPEFRRSSYISAFGEGWALYAERLGVEMGIYETPYELMGMLSYQMWRAVRLVIDPGMHALGWTREQSLAYLRHHTAIGDHEIVTEVDRYIAWPGQATAYYLGMQAIRTARSRAEVALGDAFVLSNFHDHVLSLGCVPLPVLATSVDDFIAAGGPSPYVS